MKILYIDDQVSSLSFFLKLFYGNLKYDFLTDKSNKKLYIKQIFKINNISLDNDIISNQLPDLFWIKKNHREIEKNVIKFLERISSKIGIDKEILDCLEHGITQKFLTIKILLYQIENCICEKEEIIFWGSNVASNIIKKYAEEHGVKYNRKYPVLGIIEKFYDLLNKFKKRILRNNKIHFTYYQPNKIHKDKPSILFYNSGSKAEIKDVLQIKKYLEHYNVYICSNGIGIISLNEDSIKKSITLKITYIDNLVKKYLFKKSELDVELDYYNYDLTHDLFYLSKKNKIASKLLEIINPKAVVVGNDWILNEKIIIELSRKRRIPTFAVNDGMLFEHILPRSSANHVFTFQCNLRNKYRFAHIDDHNSLFITGSPRFKMVDKIKPLVEKNHYNKRKINIVFATEPGTGENTKLFKLKYEYLFFKNIDVLSNFNLQIKLHPQDTGEITKHALNLSHKKIKINYEGNIDEILSSADLWICVCSTTAIEAAIINVPVIILDFDNQKIFQDYIDDKIIFSCKNVKRINTLIDEILFNKNLNSSILRSKIICDNNASPKIAQIISNNTSKY